MNQRENTDGKPTGFAVGLPPASEPKAAPAYCPKCNTAIGATDPICSHCGYDFPYGGARRPRFGQPGKYRLGDFARGRFGDFVLGMGALIAFVGCLAFFGVACVALAEGSPGGAIVAAMVAVLFLAMAVAFVRLTQLGPPER